MGKATIATYCCPPRRDSSPKGAIASRENSRLRSESLFLRQKQPKPIPRLLIKKITICRDRRPRRSLTHTKIGRELVFSADLCYNESNEKPPRGSLRTRSCNFRGMGFAQCICLTNAKLAIKRKNKCEFSRGANNNVK